MEITLGAGPDEAKVSAAGRERREDGESKEGRAEEGGGGGRI